MCCRYYYSKNTTTKAFAALDLSVGLSTEYPAQIITPGNESYIITGFDHTKVVKNAVWGFPGKNGDLIINARAETAMQKPMFSSSMEHRRCILPAEKFYEWDYDRNKVTFTDPRSDVIYLAGIWNLFEDVLRFVVLTTAANSSMSPYHDRMPLMLTMDDIEPWIFNERDAMLIIKKDMPMLEAYIENEQMRLF